MLRHHLCGVERAPTEADGCGEIWPCTTLSSVGERTEYALDSYGLLPELSFVDPFSNNVDPPVPNKYEENNSCTSHPK